MPVYSIIVPVYKAEKYLSACIESLLAQDTASPYEIILVDDGSPDGSGSICDMYAAKHAHITVLHKPNGGVSSARNAGIRAAAGEYVCFCDADDLYQSNYLSVMDAALCHKPDMVQVCGEMFTKDGPCGNLRPEIPPRADGEQGQAYLERCLAANSLPMYGSYYYAYRRTMLLEQEIFFPENLGVNEDLDFMLRCIPAAACICGTESSVYLYRQHEESVVHTPNLSKTRMRLETTTKWFRIYPSGVLANLILLSATGLSANGSRAETMELTRFCWANRDCWCYATDKRARFAAALFRLLGVYNGSLVFRMLIAIKHVFGSSVTP